MDLLHRPDKAVAVAEPHAFGYLKAHMAERLSIGIDGYNLALPHGTGIATYASALAGTLHRAGHRIEGIYGLDAGRDPAMHEPLFFETLGRPTEPSLEQRRRAARRRLLKALRPFLSVEAQDVPMTERVERAPLADRFPPFDRLVTAPELFSLSLRHFGLYRRFLPLHMKAPPRIMHWTYPLPIEVVGARNIYTIHDIVPLRLPYTTLDQKRRYRDLLASCLARAARICTVSEASKTDIVREFGVPQDVVVNTWQAAPATETNAFSDTTGIEGTFGLEREGYFLFFGAIEPKKNVGRLIEAYLSLRITTPLLIVGGRGWQSEQELVLLPGYNADLRPNDTGVERIRMLPHIPKSALLRLIAGARAVLFPSLYEGFGLPVLEAMQLGAPVLTSQSSALSEVAGDAALLIDPYDVHDIAAGIAKLDEDAGLRERLRTAGRERATLFSEGRYLARLETLYNGVLADPACRVAERAASA